MVSRREAVKNISAISASSFIPLSFMSNQAFPAKPQHSRVRRDVTKMDSNDPFFAQYANAIRQMHNLPDTDPRNWRNQAIIHADHCPHGMLDFLEWHRYYITFFEKICGEMIGDPEFALPYWNWSNNNGLLPASFFLNNELNVEFLNDPSNYTAPPTSRSGWGFINSIPIRALSAGIGLGNDSRFSSIFSETAIDNLKRLTNFDSFRTSLEGSPHNTAHVISGSPNGHMINGLSSLDPIFWLHHCNVDRLWEEWQVAGNTTPLNPMVYDDQFVDENGISQNVIAENALNANALGFTYDTILTDDSDQVTYNDLPNESIAAAFQNIGKKYSILGNVVNSNNSMINKETTFQINTNNLSSELFNVRTFKATNFLNAPRNAVEQSRIAVIFKEVSYPKVSNFIVNVFLECPYLVQGTPSTDKHYAGSFAFFGQPMQGMNGGEFTIDITQASQWLAEQGRLRQNELKVQIMPEATTGGSLENSLFKVGSVEIVSL